MPSKELGECSMPEPPPASTRNPAFQSKLEPYREFIRECRARRWSYPRIAAALRKDHGLSVAPSTIFSFVKVRAKRRRLYALPPLDEPRVVPPVQVNSRAREFFRPPDPKPHEEKRRPYNI
jgi:IS30 family transposase